MKRTIHWHTTAGLLEGAEVLGRRAAGFRAVPCFRLLHGIFWGTSHARGGEERMISGGKKREGSETAERIMLRGDRR